MAATFTTFVPTPGLDGLVAAMPEITAVCETGANQGVEAAKAVAPVLTGAYQASIALAPADEGIGAAFISDSPYAIYLEFGTSDTPTFATLRRGMDGIHL